DIALGRRDCCSREPFCYDARALSGRAGGNRVAAQVAFVIAVADARRELSQVAVTDGLAAHRTEGLRLRYPAIHHIELHCPPPNEKQGIVVDETGHMSATTYAMRRQSHR